MNGRAGGWNDARALPPALEIQGLHVSMLRGRRRDAVLRGLNLCVYPGEIVAIVGPSGSGKSTLAHAVQGLIPQASFPEMTGSIRIMGVEIVGADEAHLRGARKLLLRVIPQDPLDALNPTMKVRRQLTETCGERLAADRLSWAGIHDVDRVMRSFPHQLSGGERQRVLIAMATVTKAALIVADEPTTGLDPTNKAKVLKLLRAIAEDGSAVLINTHDLSVAEASDRMAVIDAGRVVEFRRTSEVFANPTHPRTIELLTIRYDKATGKSAQLPLHRGRIESAPIDLISPVGGVSTKAAPTSPNDLILDMRFVTKSFRKKELFRSRSQTVLNSVSMTLMSGECIALVGESGIGKSTFLRIAAGLLAQDSGTVSLHTEVKPQIVFQDPKSFLTPWISIGEQIVEGLRSRKVSELARRRRLIEMLDFVGLELSLMDALPSELSVGQCQRAAIARALAGYPRLLLCDEPISALDTSLAVSMLKLLQRIRREYGTAMIMATHDQAAAEILADRIYELRDGTLHLRSEGYAQTSEPVIAQRSGLP